MRFIIPMAGSGKRLRPFTLTTPKPLFPIAGKPIVQRLVEDLAATYGAPVEEVVFIVSPGLAEEWHVRLRAVAQAVGATGRVVVQPEALGTAHAISYAGESLQGEIIIAFADTLFQADFNLASQQHQADGFIWVSEVANPSQFGIVTLDGEGYITEMVEKPEVPPTNLAIIGIYYLKDGAALAGAIQHLLDHGKTSKGEYQLTDALDMLQQAGARWRSARVHRWMDCGNPDAVLDTDAAVLEHLHSAGHLPTDKMQAEGCVLIHPVWIGPGARLQHAVIGPYVSVGAGAVIENSVVAHSIIMEGASVQGHVLRRSILGAHVRLTDVASSQWLGDYSQHSQ